MEPHPAVGPRIHHGRMELSGIDLRYLLTLILRGAGRPLTVAELIRAVERAGFAVHGRPSKTISDALRWEIARGRVERLGRGVYGFAHAPRPTLHRMRRRIDEMSRWADDQLSA